MAIGVGPFVVYDVSFELPNPFEDTATVYGNRLRLATAHCRLCPVIFGGLESEIPYISVELGLVGYDVSIYSNDDNVKSRWCLPRQVDSLVVQ